MVFRENTEGSYVGSGGHLKKGTPDEVAVQEDISTRKGVERIVRHAFEFAKARGRKRVVMSDKSNAMRFVGDLWQRTFFEVAREHPGIEASHLYIDALCMQMVKDPRQFEVIVTNNMFGDIATDLGAALQGGLGMAASGNLHPGRVSMFEPVHGSRPEVRRHGQGQPVRRHPDGRADARSPRPRRGGDRGGSRGRGLRARGGRHGRRGGLAVDLGGRRRRLRSPAALGSPRWRHGCQAPR